MRSTWDTLDSRYHESTSLSVKNLPASQSNRCIQPTHPACPEGVSFPQGQRGLLVPVTCSFWNLAFYAWSHFFSLPCLSGPSEAIFPWSSLPGLAIPHLLRGL